MNSEVPPIPESDNPSFKQNDSIDSSLDELQVESTSDFDDAWLEDDMKDIDEAVDVTPEPLEVEGSKLEPVNFTVIEPDLAATNDVLEPTDLGISSQQNIESTSPEANAEQIIEEEPKLKVLTFVEGEKDLETSQQADTQPSTESELFVDTWLDEPKSDLPIATSATNTSATTPEETLNQLEDKKADLQREIAALTTQKEQMLIKQVREAQDNLARMIEEGTKELKERKTSLQIEIEKLERRRDRINQEMRASFAGSSQELAVKVQGFKEYLVGSLQDLARAADKLDLARSEAPSVRNPSRGRSRDEGMAMDSSRDNRDRVRRRDRGERTTRDNRGSRNSRDSRNRSSTQSPAQGQLTDSAFADQSRRIRQLIDQYRNNPDYYGPPWQLRRTFEPVHAKKVQDWFFVQGGRGAVDSMGSRLQNILVASAAISILHNLHGDRCRVLVLTDTPENLGEWRRGLQDCLGISRSNFGSNRGVTLFDSPEVTVQRAERLIEDKLLPVIIIDETDELLNLSVLKFPVWLAFASSNKQASSNYLY